MSRLRDRLLARTDLRMLAAAVLCAAVGAVALAGNFAAPIQKQEVHQERGIAAESPCRPESQWQEVQFLQPTDRAAARNEDGKSLTIQLCQACGPVPCGTACERRIDGVDCQFGDGCGEPHWNSWGPIPWQAFAQGEYVGPARLAHVPEYRLRVDDEIEFIYRLTRRESATPYHLQVGDVLRVESAIDPALNRDVTVQPDGTIVLLWIEQIRAARLTVVELQNVLRERYKKFYKEPDVLVTPLQTNTRLEELKNAVDNRFFSGGQGRRVRVNPEGTVSLPGIDQVPAQGLSLEEIKREVNERYAHLVDGLEVTPNLAQRAPRYVFVVGEVRTPGRYSLEGPTTAIQSIALAGGWSNGGNVRHIVVFRRAEDWRLLATRLDLQGALYGKRPAPADEIWLRDSDIVVVPKSTIKQANDLIELVFTNGIYRVFPISFNYTWGNGSTITNSTP